MKRFVTYIYAYEDNKKGSNTGFAKFEIRGDDCRIEIHLRGVYTGCSSCKVYLFLEDAGDILGVPIGEMAFIKGTGDFGTVIKSGQIRESPYGIYDMEGVFLLCENEGIFMSRWKEGAQLKVDREHFREWEAPELKKEIEKLAGFIPKEGRTVQNYISEKDNGKEKIQRNEPEQQQKAAAMPDKCPFAEVGRAMMKFRNTGFLETTENPKQHENEDIKKTEETGAVEMIRQRSKTEEGSRQSHLRSIEGAFKQPQTSSRGDILKPRKGTGKGESLTQPDEGDPKDAPEQPGAGGMEDTGKRWDGKSMLEVIEQAKALLTSGNFGPIEPAKAEEKSKEQVPKKETVHVQNMQPDEENVAATEIPMRNIFPRYRWSEIWEELLKSHPVSAPFEEDEISCVRIELRDLRELPKRYWYLGNNSFLLHGFFNYHYLIIGKAEEDRWFIGIPGIYQRQEKVMAAIFGFPEFIPVALGDKTKRKEDSDGRDKEYEHETEPVNRFGYWYRFMEE